MKLLVTGAGGLIGAAVVRAASAAGIATVACGRRAPADPPAGVEAIGADLADPAAAAALIAAVRPTHVIHAAWETRQPTYWNDPVNLDWVVATASMARAFARIGGTRFVQVGSCAEYDWTSLPAMRDGAATRYGKAKIAAFRAVETAAHDAFAAAEARLFWVYGPGENPARFIPLLCRSYANGAVPDLGSGGQRRDLVHVEDAARALLALLADDAPSGVVDVGTGRGTLLAEVARIVAQLAHSPETGLGRRPDRADDPALLLADPRRLAATGWVPRIPLARGLAETLRWWSGPGQGSARA